MKRLVLSLALLAAFAPLAPAQSARNASAKKALAPQDFDQWRSIDGERLSADGSWALYSIIPQVGDGEVVARSVRGSTEFRQTRGYIGRPQTRPGSGRGPAFNAPAAQFFGAGHVAFTIEPSRDEFETARRQKKRPADQPKSSLGIMRLSDGSVTVVPRVKSFEPPRGDGRFLVYLLHPADSSAARGADSARTERAAATPGGEARPVADSAARGRAKKKEYGSPLVIRELSSGAESRIEDVLAVEVDPKGTWLAYVVSSRDSTKDGLYLRRVAGGESVEVARGEAQYKGLAFDKAGTQLAFVSDREEAKAEKPRYALYVATVSAPAPRALVPLSALGDSMIVSDRTRLEFSEDGARLQFGVAPPPLDSIPADSLADKAVFDLWHWKDPRLQPQQRVEAQRDRGRSYAAVADVRARRFRVIGNDTLAQVRFSRDLRTAVANTSVPYSIEAMWGEGGNDVYLIDATTGARKLVAERIRFNASLSPGSRYVLFFGNDRHWHAYATATGRTVNITEKVEGVRFDQETWDTPSDPAPWGVAGWTPGDRSVLVYDRYDIWQIDPTGAKPARVVTDSVGRQQEMVFRYVQLDTAAQFIDPSAPIMLSALNERTKAAGAWRDRIDVVQRPESLYMADRRFSSPRKADSADVLLFASSTFTEFPDLYASSLTMRDARKLSAANPQQAEYRWGTAHLVQWRSMDGVPLQGILYKPEDFDPAKQYPMVVYFYEQLSNNLHAHQTAVPRNTIQPTLYASNGYLAFFPDIHYSEGYPGASALKSILPGVQMLLDSGFVKPDGIGISGQSWGGYQAAYIITRTNLFSAAFAGAPVANMTSAYGGIRWESGLARAFQYEKAQSRIGGSLWDMPLRYLENSPLFHADRIQTPLMMMHNDADGAVPWYQGIEMFVAMRRLGKEVYLINYNDDAHNPTKRANQLDVAMRQMQFFDHHLRGMPAPEWMQQGIPFLQKGRDLVTPERTVTEEKVSATP
ncbi:MAG TPA: prolyl oligopeptidase family serine peptidase [Gemmatimonadaceae bacterium]|nr:prolyl oligopeptidase family serine peptidase [Gemmatimonadaceae bacterium]